MARVAFKTASQSYPSQGNRELPVLLDFTATGVIQDDLFSEQSQSQIETIQSVYIDNSQNAASLQLLVRDTQQLIVAQPYTQGIYPIVTQANLQYQATTAQGIKIQVIFSNVAKQFAVWGPTPGVLIVPPLVNPPINFAPLAVGDNVLVAGVANTTIKIYRMLFGFGGGSNVQFFSGPSANNNPVTGILYMFGGGGITMQPSGIPWFTTRPGDALILNSTVAANMGGILGYVQS